MHCWKAVRMTAQSFQAVARKKCVGFVKSRKRNCSSKRTNLYQKTAVKLMVRMNEKGFCIIIFSLSFHATNVMASRDACETKSVSLQISLLATVPCKETPRCLLWNTRPPPCSRMEARDSGTRMEAPDYGKFITNMASSLPRERPQRPSEPNRWRCRSDFGSRARKGGWNPCTNILPCHPISKPPLHFGSGDQAIHLRTSWEASPPTSHLGIRRSPCTPTQIADLLPSISA